MTVIAAVVDGGRVHMAADSLAIGRDDLHVPVCKIVVARECGAVLGVAGQASLIPLAGRILKREPASLPEDIDGWAQRIADEVTTAGLDLGAKEEDDTLNGEMLLARGGRLWDLSHHSAIPIDREYAAVGSGAAVAIGVLWASVIYSVPAERRARTAVEAAAAHVAGIGGPITVVST